MSSLFDPNAFFSATFDSGFDTRAALHKPGEWVGSIDTSDRAITVRTVETKDGPRVLWDILLFAEDPNAQAEGFDGPARVRHTLWIDTTPEGNLDNGPGKNRDLGHLLTALGIQDKHGTTRKPWSLQTIKGMRLRYQVAQEPRRDNGEMQAVVKRVAPV